MKNSYVAGGVYAPRITFDSNDSTLAIEGNCNGLNCAWQIGEIIEDIAAAGEKPLQVIIEVNHFSAKCVFDMVSSLKQIGSAFPIEVVWRYRAWDIDHLELGEIIRSILGVPFRMQEIDC